jgi:hypothetical protein
LQRANAFCVATDHDGHVRRAAADRRIEKIDPALSAGRGEPAHRLWRVRRQVDIGATLGEAGKQTGFGIERRGFDLLGAGQRGEDDFARLCDGARRVGGGGALLLEGLGRLAADVADSQLMPGSYEAAGDRRPHRAGTDKTDPHASRSLTGIIGVSPRAGKK